MLVWMEWESMIGLKDSENEMQLLSATVECRSVSDEVVASKSPIFTTILTIVPLCVTFLSFLLAICPPLVVSAQSETEKKTKTKAS